MVRVLAFLAVLLTTLPSPAEATDFPICRGGHRITCVVDGDTFWLEGEKVRAVGLDTPELEHPRCSGPAAGAVAARDALARLLSSGEIALERQGNDRYRRTLARVTVDGLDIADVMIRAGFGRRYVPGEKPWC